MKYDIMVIDADGRLHTYEVQGEANASAQLASIYFNQTNVDDPVCRGEDGRLYQLSQNYQSLITLS
jgi:hypothetical protein